MAAQKTETAKLEPAVTNLSVLAPAPGSRKKRKRLGIGEGSGNGKTSGKGQKGQTSRSGFGLQRGFEGGQMPLHRRIPKVGFTSQKRVRGVNVYTGVSLDRIAKAGLAGDVTIDTLVEKGILRTKKERVKILGGTALQIAINIEAHAVSASARTAIEAAGGQIRLV